jgi:hypothetical protein
LTGSRYGSKRRRLAWVWSRQVSKGCLSACLRAWGRLPDLLIKPGGGWDNFASLSRFLRRDETVFSMVHRFKVGDEVKWDAHSVPTEATRGRLRLVRIGQALYYQVAEGDETSFRELFRSLYGTKDLEMVRIAATPGDSPCSVEVIWGDLTIRAEAFPVRGEISESDGRDRPR